MQPTFKEKILEDARNHVTNTIEKIAQQLPVLEKQVSDIERDLRTNRAPESTIVSQNMLAIKRNRAANLKEMCNSPYFARCDVAFNIRKNEPETLYFGKFALPELHIFSWASAAARIRFNMPGDFSYRSEAGKDMAGTMSRVDQYMIAQQKITFMTTETTDAPRTLVYHERFSQHKSEFVLPEIVERMEKAQDDIIRADAFGSFLISGPAGSGKTTLALHRIAYLLQSPEHAERFDPRKIVVLVQDKNSKQYFEKLLPSLGITDVTISTFDMWAMHLLGIKNASYVSRYGTTEAERDAYEASKYDALKHAIVPEGKEHFARLENAYAAHFTDDQKKIFARQRKEKLLDRFDLTLLLQARLAEQGAFTMRERVYSQTAKGGYKSRIANVPVKHALMLIDEVQNYLAEQIHILKTCISDETKAMTYVGDLAQQTSLFTMRDWSAVGEQFDEGRAVHLYKVYRSTKQILSYIRLAGFDVDIPEGVHEGQEVKEYPRSDTDTVQKITQLVRCKPNVLTGIIALRPEDLVPYRALASDICRVMTAVEAQGLEFDVVVFISHQDDISSTYPDRLRWEKQKVSRDQIYVALTRAMNELHVVS